MFFRKASTITILFIFATFFLVACGDAANTPASSGQLGVALTATQAVSTPGVGTTSVPIVATKAVQATATVVPPAVSTPVRATATAKPQLTESKPTITVGS